MLSKQELDIQSFRRISKCQELERSIINSKTATQYRTSLGEVVRDVFKDLQNICQDTND